MNATPLKFSTVEDAIRLCVGRIKVIADPATGSLYVDQEAAVADLIRHMQAQIASHDFLAVFDLLQEIENDTQELERRVLLGGSEAWALLDSRAGEYQSAANGIFSFLKDHPKPPGLSVAQKIEALTAQYVEELTGKKSKP